MQHEVEQRRRVGKDHPLDGGVAHVALVPERLVLHRGRGVAADHASQPADVLEAPGVALVRHRGGALLTGAELFLNLPHLAASQVPEFDREFLEARRDQREHRHQRGVAVALHHLRRDRLEADLEAAADGFLHLGR
jgi:hypothetical protein